VPVDVELPLGWLRPEAHGQQPLWHKGCGTGRSPLGQVAEAQPLDDLGCAYTVHGVGRVGGQKKESGLACDLGDVWPV
jgi:hypothetical protein